MATRTRTNRTERYGTNGSVAYSHAYGNPAPSRDERQRRRNRTYQRPNQQTRPQVQVREAGQIAPFAVVGFLAVVIMALLLMGTHAQLTMESTRLSQLRQQSQSLDAENAALTAQYEKVFDMEAIQAAVGDTMTRPTAAQIDYIDLSEPDTVVIYEKESGALAGLFQDIKAAVDSVVEYFR